MEMTEEQSIMFSALTKLQKSVALVKVANPTLPDVQVYIQGNGAAKNYDSQRACASAILADSNVLAFINSFNVDRINPAIMSRDQMAEKLSEIAFTTIDDVIEFFETDGELLNTETGSIVKTQSLWRLKDVENMSNGGLSAISELTAGKDGLKIKTHSQLTAMKQLETLLGYGAPAKSEISGPNGTPVTIATISDDDLMTKLLGLGVDAN